MAKNYKDLRAMLLDIENEYKDEHSGGVFGTSCEKGGSVQVIFHIVRSELHISVSDGNITIIVDQLLAVTEVFYDGISRRSKSRGVKRTFLEHSQ